MRERADFKWTTRPTALRMRCSPVTSRHSLAGGQPTATGSYKKSGVNLRLGVGEQKRSTVAVLFFITQVSRDTSEYSVLRITHREGWVRGSL